MVGSLGFEPRLPTPQAGILDHSRSLVTRMHTKTLARLRPQQQEVIINTLINLKNNGKAENTIINVSQSLARISHHADLTQPDKVKEYIARATKLNGQPLSNATKQKLVFAYDCLCQSQNIQWEPPKYKCEEHIPIIPTTENVMKIIDASTKRFTTIFTILAEIGLEGQELHKNNIDTERGIISVEGCKGHTSGTYKLKSATTEMLREYLTKNPQEYPFPKPNIMGQMWRKARDKLADNLKQPELRNIPMKNLRNYSGAKLYYSLPDPIAVMRHLRHKKLDTTMHYLRGIVINGEEEYTCKASKTLEEDTHLIESGFQFVTERDGYKLFRKRK